MNHAPVSCALGAIALLGIAPHAAAQLEFEDIYVGTFTRSVSDNIYYSDTGSNIIRKRGALGAILGLYPQFADSASDVAAALESSDPLRFGFGSQEPDDFGSIGDTVNFNPLATGGTVDIATGGDYIDAQLGLNGRAFTVIFTRVDVENEVFRQDFGPVQTSQRTRGAGSSFDIQWRALNPWDQEFFATDANGQTPEYRVSFSVVPAPGGACALMVGAAFCSRRRRA